MANTIYCDVSNVIHMNVLCEFGSTFNKSGLSFDIDDLIRKEKCSIFNVYLFNISHL